MKVFFSVGEPSGDLHAANLMRELRSHRSDVEFVGFGGPRMTAAGCDVRFDLTELAVMWIARAVMKLPLYLDLVRRADRYFATERPDAVVLVDYPGFNWHIARRAKFHGIPVFYYSPPQIWAWASWRITKMRRLVDHVLCGLPFESAWYSQRNCRATYIGHPYFDEVHHRQLDQAFIAEQRNRSPRRITILPGSRSQEVHGNLDAFLRTVEHVRKQIPDVHVAIAAYKESQATVARAAVARRGLPIEVHVGRTAELIESSTCCLACSGSVSLELLHHAKPSLIRYPMSMSGSWMQRWLRHTRYITLVNLLASDDPFVPRSTVAITEAASDESVLFPEFLSTADRSPDMARLLCKWLTNDESRQAREQQLIALREQVGQPGAARRAAVYLLEVVERRRTQPRPPHFSPQRRVVSSAGADVEYLASERT